MIMKVILFLLVLLQLTLFAQNLGWSNAVKISKHGYDYSADYIVDNYGNIHCVWIQRLASNFGKVFYSKSTNDGDTWSEPEDVSKNENKKCGYPSIRVNSNNNIYVTYDYDMGSLYYTEVHMRVFNGEKWSDTDTVSKGYKNATLNCLAIDNNDRVYVFWHNYWEAGKIYFRYNENSVWSPVQEIYNDGDNYLIGEVVVDKNNNLHCSGVHKRKEQGEFGYAASYYKYDYSSDNWSDVIRISTNTCREYYNINITLDSKDSPHLVWTQFREDGLPPPEGSYYSYFNDTNWTKPEPLGKQDGQRERPKIVLGENDSPNILLWRQYKLGNVKYYNFLEYDYATKTEKVIVDSVNDEGLTAYFKSNDYLIMLNSMFYFDDGNRNYIVFRRKKLTETNIKSEMGLYKKFKLSQNYPNPFNNTTNLQFNLKEVSNVEFVIYDINGIEVKVLIRETCPSGLNSVVWDGMNSNGQKVSSGIYFYRIVTPKFTSTRKMVLLQ